MAELMRTPSTILLVDQSRVSLMLQETVLRRSSNLVSSVTSGGLALARIRAEQPRLVIFGYDLDDMTAPELCRQVRIDPETRNISLLFVTDRTAKEHVELCLSAGCNDILLRPFHRRELDSKVEKLTSIPVRRDIRTLTKLEVTIQNQGQFILGHSLNISASGMYVQADHTLPPEALVLISFYLPGEATPLRIPSRIVRAEFNGGTPRYGFRFVEIPPLQKERIDAYVNRVHARDLH